MAYTADPAFSVHSSFAQTLQAYEGSDERARTSGSDSSGLAPTYAPIKSPSLQGGHGNGPAVRHADVTTLPGPSGFRHHFFPFATAWNNKLPAYMPPPYNPPGVVPFDPPAVAAGMQHRQNVPLGGPRQAPAMQQVPQVTTSHNSFASAQVVPVVPGLAPAASSGYTGTDVTAMPPPAPVPFMGVLERPMTTPSTSFTPLAAAPSRLMWPAERARLAHSRSWQDLQGSFNAPFPSLSQALGDVQFPGDEHSAADGARAPQPLPKLQWRDQICAAEAEGSCTQALSMAPSYGAPAGTSGLGQRRPPDVTWQNDDDDDRRVKSKLESTPTVRSEELRPPVEGSTASQRHSWPGSSHTQRTSALQALSHRQDATVSAVATSTHPSNAGSAADVDRRQQDLQNAYDPNYTGQEYACMLPQVMPGPDSHSLQGGAQHQQFDQHESLQYGQNQVLASTCKPNASPALPPPELAAAMAASPGATMIYSTPGALGQAPTWYSVQHIQQPHNMPVGSAYLHIPQPVNPAQLSQLSHCTGFPPPASMPAYPSPFLTGPPHKQHVYPPPYPYPPPYGCNAYGAQVGYSPYPAYSPVQAVPMSHPQHPSQPPMLPQQQTVYWQPRAGDSPYMRDMPHVFQQDALGTPVHKQHP